MANDITFILRAKNEARRAAQQLRDDLKRAGTSAGDVGRNSKQAALEAAKLAKSAKASAIGFDLMKKAASGLGAILGTVVAGFLAFSTLSSAVQGARDFNAALAETSTLLEGTPAQLKELSADARDLASTFGGTGASQLKGFYQAISAGASSVKDANTILEQANKLAIGGVTDTTTAVDILTTAINAYGPDVITAAQASDALFVAMKAGKTTVGELSVTLGNVIPLAKAAGVSFDETAAAVAALTTQGINTRTAATDIRALIQQVIQAGKEGSQAAKAAKELGVEFNITALKTKGLKKFIDDIVEATGGSVDKLGMLFQSVEALNGVLALSGTGGQKFADILQQMREKAGATDEAFKKMQANLDQRLKVALANILVSMERIGQLLLRIVVPAVEAFAKVLKLVVDNLDAFGVAIGLLTLRSLPALVGIIGNLIGYLGTMEGLFISGTIAARGLALAMDTIPFLAAVAGFTLLIRSIQGSTSELKAYRGTLKATTDAFTALGQAASQFADKGTQGAAEAFHKIAAEAVKAARATYAAADANLRQAETQTLIWGIFAGGAARVREARKALKDAGDALASAEQQLGAATTAVETFADSTDKAAKTYRSMVQTTQEAGKATVAAIPAVSDLRKKYGDLSDTVYRLLKLQQEVAKSNARIDLSNAIAGASELLDKVKLGSQVTEELNQKMLAIQRAGSFQEAAKRALDLANFISDAQGGAANLDSNTKRVVEELITAALKAAGVSAEIGNAAGNADALAGNLNKAISALNGIQTAIAGLNLDTLAKQAGNQILAAGGDALDAKRAELLKSKELELAASFKEGGVAAQIAQEQLANYTLAVDANIAAQRKRLVLDKALNKSGGSRHKTQSALNQLIQQMTTSWKAEADTVGLTGKALEDYRIKQQLLSAAQRDGVALSDEVVKSVLAQRDAYEAAKQSAQTFAAGAAQGFQDFKDSVQTNMEFARSFTKDAFTGLAGIISEFVKTGKFNFKSLIADLLGQISQFLANRLVIDFLGINGNFTGGTGGLGTRDFLSSLAGGLFSGPSTGSFGLPFGGANAFGGEVQPGRIYAVNEHTPRTEYFAPKVPGTILTHDQATKGGGGGNTFNFYINTPDANSFRRSQKQIHADMAAAMARADRSNN